MYAFLTCVICMYVFIVLHTFILIMLSYHCITCWYVITTGFGAWTNVVSTFVITMLTNLSMCGAGFVADISRCDGCEAASHGGGRDFECRRRQPVRRTASGRAQWQLADVGSLLGRLCRR